MDRIPTALVPLVWMAVAGTAAAAPLGFDATLTFAVQNLTVSVTGSGTAQVSTSGGNNLTAVSVPSGAASGTATTPQTSPAFLPGVAGLSFAGQNGSGVLTRTASGPLGGVLPISGGLRICVVSSCPVAPASIPIPVSPIGVGGTATASNTFVSVTAVGAPWTTGSVTIDIGTTSAQLAGFVHGPASNTSTAAQVGGVIQVVTPIVVSSTTTPTFRAAAELQLSFVPEPGTAALLAGGVVLLGAIGRRKRDRR